MLVSSTRGHDDNDVRNFISIVERPSDSPLFAIRILPAEFQAIDHATDRHVHEIGQTLNKFFPTR